MARHRSPQSRRPRRQDLPAADTRRAGRHGGGRSASVLAPARQGLTAAAVAGGAISLVAAAAPGVEQAAEAGEAATVLRTAATLPALGPDQVLGAPPVTPVSPEPEVADAASLVKAIGVAEEAEAERIAAEERAAAEEAAEKAREAAERAAEEAEAVVRSALGGDCGLDTSGLGAVKSHVERAAQFLGCQFGEPTLLGVGSRSGASDHPRGLALDLMTRGATGDAIAACALENMEALGVKYVIWEQRINHGDGWEAMSDRGGDTANHMDHVHVSFESGGGSGTPTAC